MAKSISLEELAAHFGIKKESPKPAEPDYSNYIPPAEHYSNNREVNERDEKTMNTMLATRVFPEMRKAGQIDMFARSTAAEDIAGTDFVIGFNDGTRQNWDQKTRWSKMNDPDNNLVPIEILRKDDKTGWFADDKKKTDVILSVLPVRVEANGNIIKPDDIKALRCYAIPVDKLKQYIEKRTGLNIEELKEKAVNTYKNCVKTGNNTNREGFPRDMFLYTSRDALWESPTCLLIEEKTLVKADAVKIEYDQDKELKIIINGNLKNILKQDEKNRSLLNEMRMDNKAPHFDSKSLMEKEQTKTVK